MFEYKLSEPIKSVGVEKDKIFIKAPCSEIENELDIFNNIYSKGLLEMSKNVQSQGEKKEKDPEKEFEEYQKEQERQKNLSDSQKEFEIKQKIDGLALIVQVTGEFKKVRDAFKRILLNKQMTAYDVGFQEYIWNTDISQISPKDLNNMMFGYFNYFLEQ